MRYDEAIGSDTQPAKGDDGMNHSRPANITTHKWNRRTDMDYKAMTKALLDQIDDNYIHRTIYEIVNSFVKHLDRFVH